MKRWTLAAALAVAAGAILPGAASAAFQTPRADCLGDVVTVYVGVPVRCDVQSWQTMLQVGTTAEQCALMGGTHHSARHELGADLCGGLDF